MAAPNEVVATLVEMGFLPDKAEEAARSTEYRDIQTAMDWILAHEDDPNNSTAHEGRSDALSQQPKSLKCEDCGKILRSELDAQAHAARTSHQNFAESTEEIKPLTAEEKKAQLAKLEERMKEKRIAREEKEKEDAKQREKLRRKSGKELSDVKQKMELAEAKKLAEERRREKEEDRKAKQRVKEQIAKDREDREARYNKTSTPSVLPQPATTEVKKDYTKCRLQIRLSDGTATVQSFNATDTLQDVLTRLGSHNTRLMTTFPKRIFSNEDKGKTLKDLELVPSAVLIQTLNKDLD